MTQSKMFKPGKIGPLTPRNRISMPAVHIGMARDGAPSDELIAFYKRRAEGGVGIITVGVCNTWPGLVSPLKNFLDLATPAAVERMTELTSAAKGAGAIIGAQLSPLVGYNNPSWRPDPAELPRIIQSIGAAARHAASAGFDFVEVMLSGGSLLSHFLSPVHNGFDIPGYSGDWSARSRGVREGIGAILLKTDGKIPVFARIHGHEFLDGGYGSEGAARIAKLLEEEGVSAVNVTGGGHRTALPQITFQTPPLVFAHLARQVREATNLPVFTGGQIRTRKQAEEALRISGAEFVNLARALIADPDWPKKAADGTGEILPCMACCRCFDQAVGGKPIQCSLNPGAGTEEQDRIRIAETPPKRALVVGSGPAGLQGAWDLQQLGYDVTVWEREPVLGGKWLLASTLRDRDLLAAPLKAFISRLERADVTLRSEKVADRESVGAFKPDVLVLAVGAKPRNIEIPGMETHPRVMHAEDAIATPELVGEEIAIIGSGGVGVELAIHLAGLGEPALDTLGFLARYGNQNLLEEALAASAGRRVTLIRRRGFTGRGLGRSIRWTLMKELERLGVRLIDRCAYREITKDGLEILNSRTNESEFIEADTIILATGYEPQNDLAEQFKDMAPTILTIGSAEEVSNIGDAVASGHALVNLVKNH